VVARLKGADLRSGGTVQHTCQRIASRRCCLACCLVTAYAPALRSGAGNSDTTEAQRATAQVADAWACLPCLMAGGMHT